jgi:hypothetical protein
MVVKDTHTNECPCYKKYLKKGKNTCPYYMETIWRSDEEGAQTKVVKDCAPKRTLLIMMELSNRLLGVQQAAEQERNTQHKVLQKLIEVQQHQIPNAEFTENLLEMN